MKILNEDGEYVVTFDPIDGCKIIDTNFAVASIVGIWHKRELNGCTGRDLVGASLSIYGSRTTMLVYNPLSNEVEELTLVKKGSKDTKWIVTVPSFEMNVKASHFSPEGVKSCFENQAYLKMFEYYCIQGYSIRYSSSLAVDCYQMFINRGGIYTSVETLAFGTKLFLLYECIPIAFLLEKAKGIATDGTHNILDIVVEGNEQTT